MIKYLIAIVLAYGTVYFVVLRDRKPKPVPRSRNTEHVHEWMLASDSQLYVNCQHPACPAERLYVGDPLTVEDVERLIGTKPAYQHEDA